MKDSYCLSCQVSFEQKEIVLGICYSLGMQGCVEDEKETDVMLQCYFPDRESAEEVEKRIADTTSSRQISIALIEDQDWNAAWRETMEPVSVAEGIWVSPTWLKPDLKKGDHWIKIEPKMAFGTGHHETTRLCAQALLSIDISGYTSPQLLDIGTGSGILCFVGDYAGFTGSIGVEIDPDCAGNLAENIRDNRTVGTVLFIIGTVECVEGASLFDTVIMNMIRTRSEPLLEKCRGLLKQGGRLVWSGILIEEKDSVIENALKKGWTLLNETTENEWWCGILGKL